MLLYWFVNKMDVRVRGGGFFLKKKKGLMVKKGGGAKKLIRVEKKMLW